MFHSVFCSNEGGLIWTPLCCDEVAFFQFAVSGKLCLHQTSVRDGLPFWEVLFSLLTYFRPTFVSPTDDLAFDIYQDPQVASVIRRLEQLKRLAAAREFTHLHAGAAWVLLTMTRLHHASGICFRCRGEETRFDELLVYRAIWNWLLSVIGELVDNVFHKSLCVGIFIDSNL